MSKKCQIIPRRFRHHQGTESSLESCGKDVENWSPQSAVLFHVSPGVLIKAWGTVFWERRSKCQLFDCHKCSGLRKNGEFPAIAGPVAEIRPLFRFRLYKARIILDSVFKTAAEEPESIPARTCLTGNCEELSKVSEYWRFGHSSWRKRVFSRTAEQRAGHEFSINT